MGGGLVVATVWDDDGSEESSDSGPDARLIAATPTIIAELLGEVERLRAVAWAQEMNETNKGFARLDRKRKAERGRADAAERLCIALGTTGHGRPEDWRDQVDAMRERHGG